MLKWLNNYRETSLTFQQMVEMRSEEVGDYLMSKGFDLSQKIDQTISHEKFIYIFKQYKEKKK